jgi:hypothetical protein
MPKRPRKTLRERFPTHGIRQETLDHVQECIKQIHDHQVLLSKELDAFAQVDTRSRRGLLDSRRWLPLP